MSPTSPGAALYMDKVSISTRLEKLLDSPAESFVVIYGPQKAAGIVAGKRRVNEVVLL